MIKRIFLNASSGEQLAPTVVAGYFKFGSRTLLLGDYGVTGGAVLMEYN